MPDHLSYSSISTYLTCARKWRFHYVDKAADPASEALLFGSAFHKAIESLIVQKDDPTQAWVNAWNTQMIERGETTKWESKPDDVFNDGLKIFTNEDVLKVIAEIKPAYEGDQPIIEKYVELRVPGVPVPIIGYIDLIEKSGIPADFKTSARSWGIAKAEKELQPVFYLAALNQAGLKTPMKFRHYVFVKNKTPKVEVLETTRTSADMFFLFDLIQEVWAAISAGAFPPSPTSFLCSPDYCNFWSQCRGKWQG